MIVVACCPVCDGPIALKPADRHGPQPGYCSRRCQVHASGRRWRARRSGLAQFTDDQLARIPQRELEPYGVTF